MNASTIARSSPFAGYDREFASLLQRLDRETGSLPATSRGSREFVSWVQRA